MHGRSGYHLVERNARKKLTALNKAVVEPDYDKDNVKIMQVFKCRT